MRNCTKLALAAISTLSLSGIALAQNTENNNTVPSGRAPAEVSNRTVVGGGDTIGASQVAKIAADPKMAGDKLFVLENATGNLWEAEFSRLVAERANDPKVKELAQMVATDHQAANGKLAPIAGKMGLSMPTALPAMKSAELDVFRAIPPEKLEMAYLAKMQSGHAKDIIDFANMKEGAEDADLKAYITEVLPKLKEHGGHINEVAMSKGINGATEYTSVKSEKSMDMAK